MKLTVLIPLASLCVVSLVLVMGAFQGEPLASGRFEPPPGDVIPDVDLGLGSRTLLGRIVDESGGGIADAGVTTEQNGRPLWTWTDGEGGFQFPDLNAGELKLRVVAQGFEATLFSALVPEDSRPAVLQSFVMDRPIGPAPVPPALELSDLEGHVMLGPLAKPEGGYEVLLMPTTSPTDGAGGFPRRADVGEDGSFSVELLHAGEYQPILLGPDARGGREPDLLASLDGSVRTFVHGSKGDTPGLDLVATMGAITGRALDDDSKPLRGALVRVEPLGRGEPSTAEPQERAGVGADEDDAAGSLMTDRSLFQATRTDKDGSYSLTDLQPGTYAVYLFAGRTRRNKRVTVRDREIEVVNFDALDPGE